MNDLILEVKPIEVGDEVLDKLKKRKSLIKKSWKLILLGLIISIVFSILAEIFNINEQNASYTVIGFIYLLCIVGSFLLFFPTILTLADKRANRNGDYIRVYTDRIECVQTLDTLIKDKENNNKEQATIYYSDMIGWILGARVAASRKMSNVGRFDSMAINFDGSRNLPNIINYSMNKDIFYISLEGYDFETWWSAMKTAYHMANKVKDIQYTTRNEKYRIYE